MKLQPECITHEVSGIHRRLQAGLDSIRRRWFAAREMKFGTADPRDGRRVVLWDDPSGSGSLRPESAGNTAGPALCAAALDAYEVVELDEAVPLTERAAML
jgi:hypothetical protein